MTQAVRIFNRAGKALAAALIVTVVVTAIWQFTASLGRDGTDPASIARATGSPVLIYSEFGPDSDTLWAIPADNPAKRSRIAVVDHAREYGIVASLSPDGRKIALTVLPPTGDAAIDAPAELWVMDVDGKNRRLLSVDVDLPVTPVWKPDSSAVVARRSEWQQSNPHFQLVQFDLKGGGKLLLDESAGLFPVGFTPDGSLYYTRLSNSGTDLGSIASNGATASVAHLSDDFARDWHLSPDGTKLAYLTSRTSADRVSFGATVLNLKGGDPQMRIASVSTNVVDEFNPIWRPNSGELTVGRLQSNLAGDPALRLSATGQTQLSALAPPSQGFDVPLMWSPDGGYLAVRSFEGDSATNPGRSWVTLVNGDERQTVSSSSDIQIVGWMDSGG